MKRSHFYLFLALCPVLLFQNCGQEYNSSSLYGDGQKVLDNSDCLSNAADCGSQTELLLISIDTPNPLILPAAATSYVISGRCNIGNYPEHYIRYEVRSSTGTLVRSQDLMAVCLQGYFEFTLSLSGIVNNQSHSLRAFIVGIDEDSRSFSNLLAGGSSQVDFYKQ